MKRLKTALLALATLLAVAGCKRSKANPDAQAEAQRNFAMVCARCHGPNGGGNGLAVGASAPRNFRDPAFQKERSDEELARVIREGKGAMPPFNNVYTPEQIAALVQVIRGFDPARKTP